MCLAVLAAVSFSSYASSLNGTRLTVGAGETVYYVVTDSAQAAELAGLTQIVFEDATGVLSLSGAGEATVNAAVTGPGKIEATGLSQLTAAGDARGFTGGWLVNDTPLVVASRYGLGDSGTVGAATYDGYGYGAYLRDTTKALRPIVFRGAGLTNDVSVFVYGESPSKTHFNYDEPGTWVQNGRFRNYKCGNNIYFSNVVFNGVYHSLSYANYYLAAGSEVVFNSPSIFTGGGTWWYRSGSGAVSKVRFNGSGNTMTEANFNEGLEVHVGADDFFPSTGASTRICLEQGAYIDLHGHDQTLTMMARKQLSNSSNVKMETVTSAVPATVTIVAGATTREYHTAAQFRGKASLRYDSPTTFRLITGVSDTEGLLEVADGVFYIDWGAEWAGTNVTVSGGNLVLSSLNSLKDDKAELVVSGGKLTIGSGVTAFVSKATIGGASIADGVYSTSELVAAYPAASGLVDGEGSLAVGQNKPAAETSYSTWTGAAYPDTSLSAGGNWEGGTAPDLSNGGADLTFTEGTSLATVGDDAAAKALHFNLQESFTLARSGNATLTLGSGGMSVTNVSAGAQVVVTNTILADISNSVAEPGGISLGPKTVLELRGRYVGGAGTAPIAVTGKGEIVLEGDNSALSSELYLAVDGNNTVPFTVRVRSATALGSTARSAYITSPCVRFECLTNDTPVFIKGYGMVNAAYDGSSSVKRLVDPGRTVVFNGKVSSYGNICGSWNIDGVTFRGGFKDNGGRLEFVVTPGCRGRIESAVDMETATKQYSLEISGNGDVHLSAAEHRYFRMVVHGATRVVCEDANSILAGYPVLFGRSNAPGGILDLGGKAQAAAFVSHLMWNDSGSVEYGAVSSGSAFGVVTSAVPATLTLTGSLTNDQHDKYNHYWALPSNAAVDFRGLAGLHFAGETASATQTLSFVQSDSSGTLHVSSGTLSFDRGAGWSGAEEVLVDGTGVLKTDGESANVLLGRAAGSSRANLRIGGSGMLDIPSGSRVTVKTLKIGDSDNAPFLAAGVYGGPEAGLEAGRTLSAIAGGGTLLVRSGGAGLTIVVR